MTSATLAARTTRTGARFFLRLAAVFVFAFAVLLAPIVSGEVAQAAGAYGDASYSSDLYGAGEGDGSTVLPPNTGFQRVLQAATDEPVLFWGSIGAILLAGIGAVLTARSLKKRKQEN